MRSERDDILGTLKKVMSFFKNRTVTVALQSMNSNSDNRVVNRLELSRFPTFLCGY